MDTITKQLALFGPFIICLFSAAGLLIRFGLKERPKKMLALFLVAASVFYFLIIAKRYIHPVAYSYWYTFHITLLMIAIPQIYFYIRELTIGRPHTRRIFIHMIPALSFLLLGSFFFYRTDINLRIQFIAEVHKCELPLSPFVVTYYLFNVVFYGQFVGYAIQTNRLLQRHKAELNQVFSDVSGYELNWVKHFIWVTILWGFAGNYEFLAGIGKYIVFEKNGYIINLVVCVLIVLIYQLAIIQNSIPKEKTDEPDAAIEVAPISNYKLKQKLAHSFEKKEIFLKKDLSIWDVCMEINSNRTYVSSLINEEFGINFNCFVNKYRINYAKKLLANPEYIEYSLNDIAMKSGFNTLISFNRAFQKCLNCTPGNFRKEALARQLDYKQ